MIGTELGASWTSVGLVALSTVAIFVSLILYTRLAGLRSFSKMSSFDFAITVAFGSLLSSVALSNSSLVDGIVALGTLYGIQAAVALARRYGRFSRVVDNQPLLLMAGRHMIAENLDRARVTEGDVRAKLREANVLNYDMVRGVVLETTGDISVLHGDGEVDPGIVDGVRDGERIADAATPA
jgi:uncharacterized membrane protein YcaP (DUF421 family)